MKNIIRSITALLLSACCLSSCGVKTNDVMKKSEDKRYLYLVAGYDDAAENTDVLFTLGYDGADNSVKIAQIPRDTYARFGASQNKINQLYASLVCSGKTRADAMDALTEFVGGIFGVTFDGYIGLGTSAFRHIVDAVGGVDLDLPRAMTIEIDGEEPLILSEGLNHVDGKGSEAFIRYRKGYVMGDLGRVDAQKMFLSALLRKLSDNLSLPTLMRIAGILQNEATVSMRLSSFATIVMDAIGGGARTDYITVPGEPAVSSSGLSYYVLNKKCAAEVAKSYMFAEKVFDPKEILRNAREIAFVNIYDDEDFSVQGSVESRPAWFGMNKRKE